LTNRDIGKPCICSILLIAAFRYGLYIFIIIIIATLNIVLYSDLLEKEEGEEDGLASVEAGMRLLEEEDLKDDHMETEDTSKSSSTVPLETMMDNFISGSHGSRLMRLHRPRREGRHGLHRRGSSRGLRRRQSCRCRGHRRRGRR
jgi:hypothetical protein